VPRETLGGEPPPDTVVSKTPRERYAQACLSPGDHPSLTAQTPKLRCLVAASRSQRWPHEPVWRKTPLRPQQEERCWAAKWPKRL
jgi:hypothetical protein